MHIGDYVYGASGDFGPSFLTAVELKTGKIAWQDRSFGRAQLLYADGKLIVLDEDGNLGLATVSPQGLKVLSRAPVLENLVVDPADAGRDDALRARPKDHRRVRTREIDVGRRFMKAYVITTGAVFGLITLAHILRVVAEGPRLRVGSVFRAPHRSLDGAVPVGVARASPHTAVTPRWGVAPCFLVDDVVATAH